MEDECPGCVIHDTLHSVTKKKPTVPKSAPISSSSRSAKVLPADPVKVVNKHGDRTVPPIVGVSDSSDDGSVA